MDEETLDQFIAAEWGRLERFRKLWEDGMRDEPEMFPVKLPPGEWDEQYRSAEADEE